MRHRDVMTIDIIAPLPFTGGAGGGAVVLPINRLRRSTGGKRQTKMHHQLMPEKIIIHPLIRRPPLRTPHNPPIKTARSSKVIDRNGEMKGTKLGHSDTP